MSNVTLNKPLPDGNNRLPKSCDAWGARIETTLLRSLSEEERNSLVEHVLACSTCAERIRESQLIEELASHLPEYYMQSRNLEQMGLLAIARKHQRKEKNNKKRLTILNKIFIRLRIEAALAWLERMCSC